MQQVDIRALLKSSPVTWPFEPVLGGVAQLAGLCFASAINSCTVFAGTDGWTTSTLATEPVRVIGARSRATS